MSEEELIADLGFAIVSRRIVTEGRKVRWMYREEPAAEFDSGWRFFGDDQYAEGGEDAFGMFPVSAVAEADPSIVPHLHREPPCAFERADDYLPLVEAQDWAAPDDEDEPAA
jgi:hypothetical protein